MATHLISEVSSDYSLPINPFAPLKGDKWWFPFKFQRGQFNLGLLLLC